jgi:4-hydroxy-3-polyprenylbenzoate decarboxylase
MTKPRIVVGISGASGAAIGLRIIDLLVHDLKAEVHVVISRSAERTIEHEVGLKAFHSVGAEALRHSIDDVGASIASGSFRTAGMIVAPCSMRTLAAIATGNSDNLLLRAADVQLKERRRLVLIARESPLHLVHLRHMATVTELGAIVAPPAPAFYRHPQCVEDIVEHIARRAIDLLDLRESPLSREWMGSDQIRSAVHETARDDTTIFAPRLSQ